MAKNIELHAHPFLGKENTIRDVVEAMDKTGIDILALEELDSSLHKHLEYEIIRTFPIAAWDSYGILLEDGKCLLRGREYNTKENLHILSVGYTLDTATPDTEIREVIDKCLENNALVILDHPFVDNGKTRTAGHIGNELEGKLIDLCKEYSGNITLEWNGYSLPWVRFLLGEALNLFGHPTFYFDVNRRAEKLSYYLLGQGYNVPIVADTDLHARKKKHLKYLGTARIISDVQGDTPATILDSLKNSIFSRKHTNIKNYVSAGHLFEAFCLPVIFSKFFYKPRS